MTRAPRPIRLIAGSALLVIGAIAAGLLLSGPTLAQRAPDFIKVDLGYRSPGPGPKPNFSPKGTQVPLQPVDAQFMLPAGATRPALAGTIQVGAAAEAYVRVLATSDPAHPRDLTRLYLDLNRNGNFNDDGAGWTATPTQNEKTKAWWSSFSNLTIQVPYAAGVTEPYLINAWIVRDDEAAPPPVIRYSVGSWRAGTATVRGQSALVAVMDSDNNAIFDGRDTWSVLGAAEPNADKDVLTYQEARPTTRLMFVKDGSKETVLEFVSVNPDGRSLTFRIVDRPITKAADRAPDDLLGAERGRPRASTPFTWTHDLAAAQTRAKAASKLILIDFETTWCGPCKSMDEWIWTDAEVAARLNARYLGVKLDGDIEKALVQRFAVKGYPTMIVIDANGREVTRFVGYKSSSEMLAGLK